MTGPGHRHVPRPWADPDTFRPWRPDDPARCAHASTVAKLMPPCGPPVFVVDRALLGRPRPTGHRAEALCALHAAGRFVRDGVGKLCQAAERRARERVLAAHPDELQQHLDAEAAEVLAQVRAALPERLRAMIPTAPAAGPTTEQERPSP